MNYAGFWIRFLAALLDGIILYIVTVIIAFAFGVVGGTIGVSSGALGRLGSLISIVISWLYYASLESSPKQATIGKQAMKIVVTDLNGERITFGRATIRYFSKILSSIILMIGYIMAAFTEKKQALHDIIAGTLVLQK